MGLVEFIILGLFDQISYLLVSKKLLSVSNIRTKKILMFFITMIVVSNANYYLDQNYNLILNMIIFFLITLYIYRRGLIETFYTTIITISIVTVIQAGVLIFLSLIFNNIDKSFYYGLLAQSISLISTFIFTSLLPLDSIFQFVNRKNKVFISLTMNAFFLIFTVLLYWNSDIEGFFENIILIGIVVIILLALNALFITKGLEDEHKRAQLEMYNRYQKITEELIDDIKSRQHEFDNHIQAISMSEHNNIGIDYIENLKSRSDLGTLVKLESSLLSGLLYGKKKEAIAGEVDFQINIEIFDSWRGLKENELIDIVGNLLDNAFEATRDCSEKNVILDFKKEDGKNVIQIKNNYKYLSHDLISLMFKKGFSTKEDSGRGFGLYNVRKILSKYNGKIEVQNITYLDKNYIMFKVKM